MSHFVVLVIGDDVEGQLQPYHEFECTGTSDQYVVTIDELKDHREEYDARQNKDYPTFAEFLEQYHGIKSVMPGEIVDVEGEHKYGWFKVNSHGEVTECFRRTNPRRHWDWWMIGGRWAGYFTVKHGVLTATLGEASLVCKMDPDYEEPGDSQADQLRKGDIDIEAMRSISGQKAADTYDKVKAVIGEHPPALPWATIRDKHEGDKDWDAAREEYQSQPAVAALRQAEDRELTWINAEDFNVSREQYIQATRDRSVTPFAVVKDGVWYEKGSMGWWGMVSNEEDQASWNAKFNELFDSLPDDVLVTAVDCHI